MRGWGVLPTSVFLISTPTITPAITQQMHRRRRNIHHPLPDPRAEPSTTIQPRTKPLIYPVARSDNHALHPHLITLPVGLLRYPLTVGWQLHAGCRINSVTAGSVSLRRRYALQYPSIMFVTLARQRSSGVWCSHFALSHLPTIQMTIASLGLGNTKAAGIAYG